MKRIHICLLAMLFLAMKPALVRAQDGYAIAKTKVLFREDLTQDTAGRFPSRWHLLYCNEEANNTYAARDYWRVQSDNGVPSLASASIPRLVAPNMPTKAYLPDTFRVSFDFFVLGKGSCAEIFFGPRNQNVDSCKRVSFHVLRGGIHLAAGMRIAPTFSEAYPGTFAYDSWHHFELAYTSRKIDGYVDGHHLISFSDCKFVPGSFSLGCVPPVKYRNILLTTTEPAPDIAPVEPAQPKKLYNLDQIIVEKKIVTHDIHFDVNKATVKSESMPFINDLADWMKANDTVKLRIDGHTDSDGKVASNVKLSHDRAESVKSLLIDAGVSQDRISTEGFGPNKPIASNKTKDGKAKNRRVEFLKQ